MVRFVCQRCQTVVELPKAAVLAVPGTVRPAGWNTVSFDGRTYLLCESCATEMEAVISQAMQSPPVSQGGPGAA